MSRPNFVVLLGLPLEPEEQDSEQLKAILQKQKLAWNKDREHPRKGPQLQRYIELWPEMQAVMLDPELRKQEYAAARAERASSHQQLYAKLKQLSAMPARKGFLTLQEFELICKHLPELSEAEIRQQLTVPVKESLPASLPEPLDPSTLAEISRWLEVVPHRNLYEVLNLPDTASATQLCAAADALYQRYSQRAHKTSEVTAYVSLSSLCHTVFADEVSKRRYDSSLVHLKMQELAIEIEMATVGDSLIDSDEFSHLVQRAVSLGVAEETAQVYLIGLCEKNKWAYQLPAVARKSAAPQPVPPRPNQPQPTPATELAKQAEPVKKYNRPHVPKPKQPSPVPPATDVSAYAHNAVLFYIFFIFIPVSLAIFAWEFGLVTWFLKAWNNYLDFPR